MAVFRRYGFRRCAFVMWVLNFFGARRVVGMELGFRGIVAGGKFGMSNEGEVSTAVVVGCVTPGCVTVDEDDRVAALPHDASAPTTRMMQVLLRPGAITTPLRLNAPECDQMYPGEVTACSSRRQPHYSLTTS